VLVRLAVEVHAAHGTEPGAVGPAEDLLRQLERDRVARPRRELEPIVDDVGCPQLLVGTIVGRVIFAPVDRDRDDCVLETPHARPVQARLETEPKDVATRRSVDRELGWSLGRNREVALATKLERLELHEDFVSVLLTRTEPKLAEGIRRHGVQGNQPRRWV
jgi:hypothetical protein